MKADYELRSALEDIYFKYERMEALVSVLQQYVAECVEVVGAPNNAVDYSLYEIEFGIREANKKLKRLLQVEKEKVLHER